MQTADRVKVGGEKHMGKFMEQDLKRPKSFHSHPLAELGHMASHARQNGKYCPAVHPGGK